MTKEKTYTVVMMSKKEFVIDQREMREIAEHKGLIYISRIDKTLNTASIEYIEPTTDHQAEADRTEGYLPDGTKVIKRFGTWKDANNPDVRMDLRYYPELAKDEVMSKEEFEQFKVNSETLNLKPGAHSEKPKRLSGDNARPESMSALLEQKNVKSQEGGEGL